LLDRRRTARARGGGAENVPRWSGTLEFDHAWMRSISNRCARRWPASVSPPQGSLRRRLLATLSKAIVYDFPIS
jgi:hypothetical protein